MIYNLKNRSENKCIACDEPTDPTSDQHNGIVDLIYIPNGSQGWGWKHFVLHKKCFCKWFGSKLMPKDHLDFNCKICGYEDALFKNISTNNTDPYIYAEMWIDEGTDMVSYKQSYFHYECLEQAMGKKLLSDLKNAKDSSVDPW